MNQDISAQATQHWAKIGGALRRNASSALLLGLLLPIAVCTSRPLWSHEWHMRPVQIKTRWAALVSPSNALSEYPRPQFVRKNWQNLNGLWSYAITAKDAQVPVQYQGKILVPYPLESALSGVEKALHPDQLLWYRRMIKFRSAKGVGRTLLHFGAVDYEATVYLNGQKVGSHSGGYQNFTCDITNAIKPGNNELVVRVYDPTDYGPNPRGKQTLYPQGIMYTSSSGIWQTVWLESVPQTYIESLVMTPDINQNLLRLQANVSGPVSGYTVEATALNGSIVVAKEKFTGATDLHISQQHLWSPDDPFLYDLQVRLLKDGKVLDEVKSYFGLRKIEVNKDKAGRERIFLNNGYIFNLGVLDQGFWPEGIYTAPSDAALKFDIEAIKAMGFNTIRKHVKVEPERWYYYCDKLGVMVWQDMVPAGDGKLEAHTEFEKELRENFTQLHNHPSITTWVLFNEGWGAYDQERLARLMKQLDPSRLVNGHSGANVVNPGKRLKQADPAAVAKILSGEDKSWLLDEWLDSAKSDQQSSWIGSDLTDIHVYPGPAIGVAEPRKARVLGEYGGIGVFIENHTWNDLAGFGYVDSTPAQTVGIYEDLIEKVKNLEAEGLSGAIYTQPFDVEGEQNGLMTYDRDITKIPVKEMVRINSKLVHTVKNPAAARHDISVAAPDLTPESQRYAALLAEYDKGNDDPAFLWHFALMALRAKDQAHATEAANTLISRSAKPYSKETWMFINASTRTSKDRGLEILRTQAKEADAVLGKEAAEQKIREVIGREEVEPYLSDKTRTPDWSSLEAKISGKYGVLGTEKVYGTAMVYYLGKSDWANYAKYYALYFSSAAGRPEYPIGVCSYQVLMHVADQHALEAAIKAMRRQVEADPYDPSSVDIYANLLYKAGRVHEAIEWQEKAVQLDQDRNEEIMEHLDKMKAGQPTWPII